MDRLTPCTVSIVSGSALWSTQRTFLLQVITPCSHLSPSLFIPTPPPGKEQVCSGSQSNITHGQNRIFLKVEGVQAGALPPVHE